MCQMMDCSLVKTKNLLLSFENDCEVVLKAIIDDMTIPLYLRFSRPRNYQYKIQLDVKGLLKTLLCIHCLCVELAVTLIVLFHSQWLHLHLLSVLPNKRQKSIKCLNWLALPKADQATCFSGLGMTYSSQAHWKTA